MMHANPVEDAEHLAVFGARDATTGVITGGLVPNAAVTDTALQSGSWKDGTIWSNGVPKADDNVLIPSGVAVTLDDVETAAALRTVRVDGKLAFDPTQTTALLVDTIIVEPGGVYQMGTSDHPVDSGKTAKVIFADRGPIDLAWDPLQFSRGMVSHGNVSIYGQQVQSYATPVNPVLPVGSTQITFAVPPVGWNVGDRLVVSGNTATDNNNHNQDEEADILNIQSTATGTVVTLGATDALGHPILDVSGQPTAYKLKYRHDPAAPGLPAAYVSDVSRNVDFESQNITVVARRGHMMFMHTDTVHISGVGFYGLGRTDKRIPIDDPVLVKDVENDPTGTLGLMTTDIIDQTTGHRVMVPVLDANGNPVIDPATGKPELQVARTGLNPRGRYALHFHRTDPDSPPATVDDVAVVDSPGWGIVNHSSNVIVSNSTVYNVVGAAYVTEAGDETGAFIGNIALHSAGTNEGIENRQNVGDFGFQGNGFWLQGGNVTLDNNVVTGQHRSAYVFFPRGLDQKGLGVTQIPISTLSPDLQAWYLAHGMAITDLVPDGDVPLREFQNNVAIASNDGFESWFSLLSAPNNFNTVVDGLVVARVNGDAVFTPYTNDITFRNVTAWGNLSNPHSTAFDRNDVTRNAVYDHVLAEGFNVGINVAVNGSSTIDGGTFDNLRNILINTANDRGRTVDINDGAAGDPIQFLDNLVQTTTVGGLKVQTPRTQWDIYLQSKFNPREQDISRLFNPDVIQLGTVRRNGVQLYYLEQAANYIPFPSTDGVPNSPGSAAPAWVPSSLLDLTNEQLYAQFGLAIGGIVAPPADPSLVAGTNIDPTKVNAVIGAPSTYDRALFLSSKKYYNDTSNDYLLAYRYYDPTNASANAKGYVTVKETTPTPLVPGWNVVTRQIVGQTRSLLVYDDVMPPSFVPDPTLTNVINPADLDNGSTYYVEGTVVDDSFGKMNFRLAIKLNDPSHVSALQSETETDGTVRQFVNLTFTIQDFAGNTTLVTLKLYVDPNAPTLNMIGYKNLPTIAPSVTLTSLLGHN
jgi:hypothetical protein